MKFVDWLSEPPKMPRFMVLLLGLLLMLEGLINVKNIEALDESHQMIRSCIDSARMFEDSARKAVALNEKLMQQLQSLGQRFKAP